MLVVTGIFDNERFIPDRPVSIPQKKKVVVTIEEEKTAETKTSDSIKHSAYGCLRQYADPAKIPGEKGAWERAVLEKHAEN